MSQYAVLGVFPNIPFTSPNGHVAYWDGWYSEKSYAAEMAEHAEEEHPHMRFCVVKRKGPFEVE